MITDNVLTFSQGQNVTATANGTNDVDLGGVVTFLSGGEYGDADGGKQLNLYVVCSAAVPASNTSVVITLLTADDSAFSVNSSTIYTSAAITAWAAGSNILQLVLPRGVRRYLRITYTVTNNFTSSSIYAGLTPVVDTAEAAVLVHD